MCWIVYIASDQPLLDWHTGAQDLSLRLQSLEVSGSESAGAGMIEPSPHCSLPHVYFAHVGASCGYSCGLDAPELRPELFRLIEGELAKGTRLELVFSHADYVHGGLELTAHLTPSAVLDLHHDWEARPMNRVEPSYVPAHGAVPLGGDRSFLHPRRVRFVSEAELEQVSQRMSAAAPPRHPDRGAQMEQLASKEIIPRKLELPAYLLFIALVYLLIRWWL